MSETKLASAGNNIKLWDPANNYILSHEYSPHKSTISDISWSYDGQFLASASSTSDKLVVAAISHFYVTEISPKNDQQCVCFSKNTTRHLFSGGASGEINLWDLKLHRVKKSFRGHTAPVTKIRVNFNDATILSGSARGDVILHNVVTGLGGWPLRAPNSQAIRDLKYSGTKRYWFATASDDGMVNLWDAIAGKTVHSFKEAHNAPAMALAFSPVGDVLLTSVGLDKKIVCFDAKSKNPVRTLTSDQPLTSMDFLNAVTIAVGSTRGKISIFDLRQPSAPIHSFSAHTTSVQCLTFQTITTPSNNYGHKNPMVNQCKKIPEKRLSGKIDNSTSKDQSRENISRKRNLSSCIFSPLQDDIVSPLRDDIVSPLPDNSLTNIRKKSIRQNAVLHPLFLTPTPRRRSSLQPSLSVIQDRLEDYEHSADLSLVIHSAEPSPIAVMTEPLLHSLAGSVESTLPEMALKKVAEDLQSLIVESMEDVDEVMKTNFQQLRIDIIKEFIIQKHEIAEWLQRYAIHKDLATEVLHLREENRRLQARFY